MSQGRLADARHSFPQTPNRRWPQRVSAAAFRLSSSRKGGAEDRTLKTWRAGWGDGKTAARLALKATHRPERAHSMAYDLALRQPTANVFGAWQPGLGDATVTSQLLHSYFTVTSQLLHSYFMRITAEY
jgi:hypothetical protein